MSKTSVFLFLNRACNLSCNHCYVSAEPGLEGSMALDTFIKIVDAFRAHGVSDFRLTGGEPTINRDLLPMLEFLQSKQIAPRLITNGIRLMRMRSPRIILEKVSRCWISVYGITEVQHRSIAGDGCYPLADIMDFIGKQASSGHWIGISVLLSDATLDDVTGLLELAIKHRVRHLRFIYGEPTGRAAVKRVGYPENTQLRGEAILIVERLQKYVANHSFDFLSITNPFGIELKDKDRASKTSCMLGNRRMWSVSPEGDVYSCCFNVYDPAHLVTTQLLEHGAKSLDVSNVRDAYASRCKALAPEFWNAPLRPTCPISAVTLINSHSLSAHDGVVK